MTLPVIIVGGGIAGLSAALALAPLPVLLISKAPPGQEASSPWAQGGIAAAVGPDDSPALHAADTRAAGDGLCDAAVVDRITAAGPDLIARLAAAGVAFDRAAGGALALGLEAAHARRRIVHAGDSTGRAVTAALAARVRQAAHITLLDAEVRRLTRTAIGAVSGVVLASGQALPAAAVVLATGGIGGLFLHTTNPRGAWGQGLLLAAQAGATLADLEFIQFHPTALDVGRDPMPLVSEAVRGEGAILIDQQGTRFMAGRGRAELEPRDVVARAVWAQLTAGNRVFLDARVCLGAAFAARFPAIAAFCAEAGIDPATAPIPIRPAAHYHMGGIAVDEGGRTGVANLYACGECAATGLHGANRLASNSLLEAGVCGAEVAAAIACSALASWAPAPPADRAAFAPADPAPVRPIVSAALGVLRDEAGIARAIAALAPLAEGNSPAADPARVALLIATSALRRRESRGGHFRTDHPRHAATTAGSRITLAELRAAHATA